MAGVTGHDAGAPANGSSRSSVQGYQCKKARRRKARKTGEWRYATLRRSRSEQGSISATIFLTVTLGALRRHPTAFILMRPATSIFASAREVRLRPSAHLHELRDRLRFTVAMRNRRFSGAATAPPHRPN